MWGLLRFMLFVVGAFVLFGATAGLYWEHFYAALEKDGQVVTATVTSVVVPGMSHSTASDRADGAVHFAFQTESGKTIQSKRKIGADAAQHLRVGAKVSIRYLPTAPSVHEIAALSEGHHDAGLGRWLQYLLLAFVGAGVMFWASDTARLRKPRMNLALNELAGEAQAQAPAAALASTTAGAGIAKRFR